MLKKKRKEMSHYKRKRCFCIEKIRSCKEKKEAMELSYRFKNLKNHAD